MITTDELPKKSISIKGVDMAYVEMGEGDPIVFLHGNPTSSYLWRNVMPHLEGRGRLIAPDLVGMGDSAKLEPSGPDRYSFVEHREYLFGLLEALGINENVTLVLHDWGSALGFHWAKQNPQAVRAIAYMEGVVCPLGWADWPEDGREIFQAFRSPAGDDLILQKNLFIEGVLPNAILRKLEDVEMTAYRKPFLDPGESRRPMLSWPRQIPIEGEPEEVVQIVESYGRFLSESPIPKLFVNAEPGSILTGRPRDFCRRWANQSEVTVRGLHFIQEDSPDEIGQAIANWMDGL